MSKKLNMIKFKTFDQSGKEIKAVMTVDRMPGGGYAVWAYTLISGLPCQIEICED